MFSIYAEQSSALSNTVTGMWQTLPSGLAK